jgi:hypothetical protein
MSKQDYDAIRGECIGEPGSIKLEDMQPAMVKRAKAWAKKHHKKWPPPPLHDMPEVRTYQL